jgi:hypothetical protein
MVDKVYRGHAWIGTREEVRGFIEGMRSSITSKSGVGRTDSIEQILGRHGLDQMGENERVLIYHDKPGARVAIYRGVLEGDGMLRVTSRLVPSKAGDIGVLDALERERFGRLQRTISIRVAEESSAAGVPPRNRLGQELDLAPEEMKKLNVDTTPAVPRATDGSTPDAEATESRASQNARDMAAAVQQFNRGAGSACSPNPEAANNLPRKPGGRSR